MCLNIDSLFDGTWNVGIHHLGCHCSLCVNCWENVYDLSDGSVAYCPNCEKDVSEWLFNYYPLSDENDDEKEAE